MVLIQSELNSKYRIILYLQKIRVFGTRLLRDTVRTSFELFKIMVPLSIITKILAEFGFIELLGSVLTPVMKLVGLPGEIGLVWAASILTSTYGGMLVFASLAPAANLTIAQVTVLGTMILVAHSMPLELSIAKKAGTRFRVMIILRISGAFLVGWILYHFYRISGLLQSANNAIWKPPPRDPALLPWMHSELKTYLMIVVVILVLLLIMRILDKLNITSLLTRLLEPILRLMGLSERAAPITIIGITMGIGYGGGLIIQEAKSGVLTKYDIFYSLTFMGLCHGVIEDTALMVLIGGHLSGLFWARSLFALVITFLMVKVVNRLSESTFDRFFFKQ